MSKITTHVLDAVLGKPATGIRVRLEQQKNGSWSGVSQSATDSNGRCRDLAADAAPGVYRIAFEISEYLARQGRAGIYPEISITFTCDGDDHYHLPLLLSDNSYTTYRGS